MTDRYRAAVGQGFSVGAWAGDWLVGLAIAEPQRWNGRLLIWELHVAESNRGRGVGRRMVEALADRAQASGLRVLVCETQSTNGPDVDFYRRVGFEVVGVDRSYYPNDDVDAGNVAVFMKRKLTR